MQDICGTNPTEETCPKKIQIIKPSDFRPAAEITRLYADNIDQEYICRERHTVDHSLGSNLSCVKYFANCQHTSPVPVPLLKYYIVRSSVPGTYLYLRVRQTQNYWVWPSTVVVPHNQYVTHKIILGFLGASGHPKQQAPGLPSKHWVFPVLPGITLVQSCCVRVRQSTPTG